MGVIEEHNVDICEVIQFVLFAFVDQNDITRKKMPSTEDRGHTDRVTTHACSRLRRYRWPRPRHAARLAALARS